MKSANLLRSVPVVVFVVLAPGLALACGELRFNAGKGLPFQTYLAPRPADILILSNAEGTDEYSMGLEKAGHSVTVVQDAAAMRAVMSSRRFDVVIASYESADVVESTVSRQPGSLTKLLPVVARSARNSADVRSRFEQFVVDGASLGQYLTVINRLLPR